MTNTAAGSFGGSSSFVHGGSKRVFDVRKEEDVIELLRNVHQHALDAQIKNHLRDLIFTYRHTLSVDDAKLVAQSFVPIGISVIYADHAQNALPRKTPSVKGFVRPMPRFAPVAAAHTDGVPSVPEKKELEDTHSVVEEEVHSPEQQSEIPVSTHAAQAADVVSPAGTTAAAGERIKEIKRLVNEKVGNPVNLMDSHAEVGREYMNALLDAMKKTNGAQAGELEAAMVRLESAFTTVQEIILTPHSATAAHPEEQRIQQTAATVVRTPAAESENAPIHEKPASPEAGHSAAAPSLTEASTAVPIRFASVKEHINVAPPAAPHASQEMESTQANRAVSAPFTHSVAKEKQLQDLLRLNKQKEAQSKMQAEEVKTASTDPLQSAEVTAGLNQLLSEWGLFKSSGLFGTGPNGKDHPLFKKLEALTMAAVIAGRFEGATPAIKQSITDYMNGWRYEEGIVHEHTETFEHYLRKVVAQILNRKRLG